MGDLALSSACGRILLDARVCASEQDLLASLAGLRDALAGRRLALLHPGDLSPELRACSDFAETITGGSKDEGLPLLTEALKRGELASTLLVTGDERLTAWARQQSISVLVAAASPSPDLPALLSLPTLVLRDAAALVLRAKRRKEDRPFLIGINGIDKSGKTGFSERLATQLQELGFSTDVLSLDIFTAPKKMRRAKGYSEAEEFYCKHYAMDRLQEQLLHPLQVGREGTLQLDVYDVARDRMVTKRSLSLDRRSMVLLEGPFLFQEELFPTFDFRIYLVTDFEKSLELELHGIAGKKYEKRKQNFIQRELAAQSIYLRQETPWKRAHLVLRGANTSAPRIESWHLST